MSPSRVLLAFVAATLVGGALYGLIIFHLTYRALLEQNEQLKNTLMIAGILRYGIVESIDPLERRMSVAVQRYPGDLVHGNFSVPPTATIIRQSLVETGGIYESLSAPVPASFSDIKVGDRVAIRVQRKSDGFSAEIIYFGNPL